MRSRYRLVMRHNVRCPDGTLLKAGEAVQKFVPKWHHRRVTQGQMETARITADMITRRADGRRWKFPQTLIRGDKLVVVEYGDILALPILDDRTKARMRQKELLD